MKLDVCCYPVFNIITIILLLVKVIGLIIWSTIEKVILQIISNLNKSKARGWFEALSMITRWIVQWIVVPIIITNKSLLRTSIEGKG